MRASVKQCGIQTGGSGIEIKSMTPPPPLRPPTTTTNTTTIAATTTITTTATLGLLFKSVRKPCFNKPFILRAGPPCLVNFPVL